MLRHIGVLKGRRLDLLYIATTTLLHQRVSTGDQKIYVDKRIPSVLNTGTRVLHSVLDRPLPSALSVVV